MKLVKGAAFVAAAVFSILPNTAFANELDGPYIGAAFGINRDEVGPSLGSGGELPRELNNDAAMLELLAGYDLAVTSHLRIGAEGAIGTGLDDRLTLSDADGSMTLNPKYAYILSGRLGYLVGERTMVYARGGYQNVRVKAKMSITDGPSFSTKDDANGWLAGFGVEHGVSDHFRGRLEYRYSDLGESGARWERQQLMASAILSF